MLKQINTRLISPIKHHNGQINATNQIIEMIPRHHLYNEPFGGGATLFFAKQPAKISVVNDPNGEMVNFYETVVGDFEALQTEIRKTLHSREQFLRARGIYNDPQRHTRVERAWAVWAMAKMSFMYNVEEAAFTVSRTGSNQMLRRVENAKSNFTVELKELLEQCTVEHDDPLEVIRRYDRSDTFHYVAPPVDGRSDIAQLLRVLSMVRGKFMLVAGADSTIADFAEMNGWKVYDLDRRSRPATGHFNPAAKEEWVVINF